MTTLQFVVSYDTLYNVSILATPQCGQKIVTTSIELYYGKYIVALINNKPTVIFIVRIFSFIELSKSGRTSPQIHDSGH